MKNVTPPHNRKQLYFEMTQEESMTLHQDLENPQFKSLLNIFNENKNENQGALIFYSLIFPFIKGTHKFSGSRKAVLVKYLLL